MSGGLVGSAPVAMAAILVWIQTSLKNKIKVRHKQRSGQHTLAHQKRKNFFTVHKPVSDQWESREKQAYTKKFVSLWSDLHMCIMKSSRLEAQRVYSQSFCFPRKHKRNTCFSEHLVFSPEKLGFLRSHQGYSQRFGRKPSLSSSRIF
jgi:hypothetical protein